MMLMWKKKKKLDKHKFEGTRKHVRKATTPAHVGICGYMSVDRKSIQNAQPTDKPVRATVRVRYFRISGYEILERYQSTSDGKKKNRVYKEDQKEGNGIIHMGFMRSRNCES